ncbi:bZIP transcription factor 44 [Capsicum chacoense]|uniref:BZIP domain-containing protein n=1 Tax=Capsicum annuum TaxID=4072 RepID=A0A1U8H072_CAPAN|nr:bZIP transcription factor 44 [Capsicum annuum]KAF3621057.1 hypothetical protein FXO38_32003 [Capsicum annuum]PHT62926.1 hypothetical protein T459_33213 [Capsicum annuum]
MKDEQKRSDELNLNLSLTTPGEAESVDKIQTLDEAMTFELKHHEDLSLADEKKLRRRISNKLAARRSRFRKLTHKNKLEQNFKDLQDEIALVGSKIKNMKNYNDKLRVENEMLRERLNNITDKATQATAKIEEVKLELQMLKMNLAKAQEYQHYMKIGGESFDFYNHDELESAPEIDINQYLNLDDDM